MRPALGAGALCRLVCQLMVTGPTVAVVACGGGDLVIPPDEPRQIEVVDGNDQIGRAGLPLEEPVVVRLTDEAGVGIPGRAVAWVVSPGSGRTMPQTSMTDAEGLASATWILGPSVGPNTLQAVVSEVGLATFSAFAAAGDGGGGGGGDVAPSATRSAISVDPSTLEAGSGISTITVVVGNRSGDPVENASVGSSGSFGADDGGGRGR